jgi:hypothetical protein
VGRLLAAGLLALGALLAVAAAFAGGPASTASRFARHTIDQGAFAQVTHVNGVGDVSGDGRPDLVVGGNTWLVWFENPRWKPHLIAPGGYGVGSTIVVRDLNGDGRADVLTGDPTTRTMVWFQRTRAGWARHTLATGVYCHNIDFGDLNGDGRVDIACADAIYGRVAWLERPTVAGRPWVVHRIDDGRTFWGAKIVDIDRDGRPDVVAGRAWYRNEGDGTFTRYAYTALQDTARPTEGYPGWYFDDHEYLSVLDLNRDRRPDIVATVFAGSQEGQLWAFLAPADPRTQAWQAVLVDRGPLFSVHSQAAADFDGTGAVQVAVAEMDVGGYGFGPNPDPKLLLYRLVGPASDPASWQRRRVDTVGSHEAVAVDVDGDGRLDLIGGDENGDRAVPPRKGVARWWRNETPSTTSARKP